MLFSRRKCVSTGRNVRKAIARMTKPEPKPDSGASTALRPMSDELITAAAQRPHRYRDE
jgi:hypothetical protein